MSATHGQWMGIQNTTNTSDGRPLFILHAILMHTGRVLVWSGHAESIHYATESYEWDPIADPTMTASLRRSFPAGVDIFCCHQTNLEDGRVMTVGGSRPHPHGRGIRDICIYSPASSDWTRIGEMSVGRWYPTLVTLADGSVLAFSGRDDSGSRLAPSVEHFALPIQGPSYAPQVLTGGDKHLASYPGLHLVRGGKVVLTGTTWRYEQEQSAPINTFTFRKLGGTGAWTDDGIAPAINNREEGMSILLPPGQDGKLLLVGGGWWSDHNNYSAGHRAGTDLNSAAILDTQTTPMQWRTLSNLHHPRMNVNLVLLPDAKVLVHGGHNSYKWDSSQTPSNIAELYDPVLDTWTEVAAMNERRTYHSASLLLPDGQVLTMGGVDPSRNEPLSTNPLNQKSYEFYRPPYFFKGTRPTITAVTNDHAPPDRLAYGGTITITGTSDTPVLRVALMRPGSMTHHTDIEQRYVALEFVVTAYDSATKTFTLRAGVTSDANVAPPGYYMLWVIDDQERPCERARMVHLSRRQCTVVTDRSHFAHDELNTGSATDFNDAFYVIMDGFTPEELGVTSLTPSPAEISAWAPTITFTRAVGGGTVASMSPLPSAILFEAGLGVSQRLAFKYGIRFANGNDFHSGGTPIEDQQVLINATKIGYSGNAPVRLTHQPRPFMLDGDPHWLSTDLRVFSLRQNNSRFGHNVGNSPATALTFINNVLTDFNTNPATGVAEFAGINPAQDQSPVFLSELFPGTTDRVFNFAIAMVHYRARSLPANDVRVFFRLFRALATGVEFRRNSTYRTIVNAFGERIPALGIEGGQTTTIPFFAEARVNTATQSLTQQRDQTNRRNLLPVAAGSDERFAFFGCWLDINQTPLRFPLTPPNETGPFTSGLQSIQRLLRSAHCCLVAEVDFGSNWLQDGDSPAANDSLSQRNLAIVGSENPGGPATHTVLHTFEIKPSLAMGIGVPLKAIRDFEVIGAATRPTAPAAGERQALQNLPRLLQRRADELMIEWGNLPLGSQATIFMPGIEADEVGELHGRRPGPDVIRVVDSHTLALEVTAQRVTYVPLPPSRYGTIAALFSIELPNGVRKTQVYRLTVRQIDGMRRSILGACEWVIPVTSADQLLPFEASRLAVFRHIANAIPVTDQWAPVFGRYLDHQEDKVRGLGGDPDRIEPSSLGHVPTIDTEDRHKRLCCRLDHLIVIFAILLVLALLLPGPAMLKSIIAIMSGAIIIVSLLFRLIWCSCRDIKTSSN